MMRWLQFCFAAVLASTPTPASARPPNVVLILIDDLGWMDLGCQGSSFYETPQIDRLAEQGVRFTDAYANCPVCSPSRAAILTGNYPARSGFTGHITAIGRHRHTAHGSIIPPDDYLFLRRELVTLAEALRPAGYVSASIGKWHLGSKQYWPRRQGFDVNVAGGEHGSPASYFFPYTNPTSSWNPNIPNLDGGSDGEYLTDRLTSEAIGFIEANRERPFFLYLTHYAVHTPLEAPAPLIAKYKAKLDRDASQVNAVYGAMVETVDRGVGRVLAALDRHGLSPETLVVFTSDNGGYSGATRNAPLRAAKGHLYEGGIRVPLIVRWPGRVLAGVVTPQPATLADLYPTITGAAGGQARPGVNLDGRGLMPVLTGERSQQA
ncbi:MAG: sulfatase, partial [bacterium]|nr:sulfatase [bacterium]